MDSIRIDCDVLGCDVLGCPHSIPLPMEQLHCLSHRRWEMELSSRAQVSCPTAKHAKQAKEGRDGPWFVFSPAKTVVNCYV